MPSPWKRVTAFFPFGRPRATDSGVHVGSDSSSAMQNVYFPGPPRTERPSSPGEAGGAKHPVHRKKRIQRGLGCREKAGHIFGTATRHDGVDRNFFNRN